ncbi:MAG TPA: hypothetical protein VL595_30755 [Pseudonocardia sp.]|jgi:hypothetical protein|nr:hypothetical protein [Pseudonocardia sp.]
MNPILAAAAELEAQLITPDLAPSEREAGLRYLAGLTRWATERALVGSDPQLPCFVRCMDTVSKWGLENPDNIYRSARIEPDAEYLITGRRGTCADLAIEVLTALAGDDGTTGQGISSIDTDTLRVEPDGTYRIQVGGSAAAGVNHLPTGPGATEVFVRHTLGDWDEDAGDIVISRVSPPGPRPGVEELLEHGARTLRGQAGFMAAFSQGWRGQVPRNAVTPPSGGKGGGFLPGQRNAVGQFEVNADEALVFTFDPVDARYFSFGIGHYRWFVTFDYRTLHSHLNSAQAHVSEDGRLRVVLAATDPGVPNWLDIDGQTRGFIFLRWQGVTGDGPPTPASTIVPLAEVRRHLPDGEPTVTPAERAATIAARRAAADRRFFGR